MNIANAAHTFSLVIAIVVRSHMKDIAMLPEQCYVSIDISVAAATVSSSTPDGIGNEIVRAVRGPLNETRTYMSWVTHLSRTYVLRDQ